MSLNADITVSHRADLPSHVRPRTPFAWTISIAVCAAGAIFMGLHLAAASLGWVPVMACATGSCTEWVLKSHWARWLGLPVGFLSVPVYGFVLWGLLTLHRACDDAAQRRGWLILIAGATAVTATAGWFMWLMTAHLHKSCGQCILVHSLGIVAVHLIAWRAPVAGDVHRRLLPWSSVARAAAVGLLAVGALIGPQLWVAAGNPPDPVMTPPSASPLKTAPLVQPAEDAKTESSRSVDAPIRACGLARHGAANAPDIAAGGGDE